MFLDVSLFDKLYSKNSLSLENVLVIYEYSNLMWCQVKLKKYFNFSYYIIYSRSLKLNVFLDNED